MLNDAKIRAAKPRDKAYKLTDSHRLYLLVKPGGSKLWKWSYSYDGRQRTLHLGVYPKVSLVDARVEVCSAPETIVSALSDAKSFAMEAFVKHGWPASFRAAAVKVS